jgi:tetratricopeptide (TPR) repeat protein
MGAWGNRGYAKNYLNEYAEALKNLSEAIELDPHSPNIYRHRAYSYFKLGNLDLALIDVNKAIDLKKDYQSAKDFKKEILEAMNSK